MQEVIKKNIDLEKIMKKAIVLYNLIYETKWFRERKELFSEDEPKLKEKWLELKKNNKLIEISGFFDIPDKGVIPLTIDCTGFIAGPDNLSQKDLEKILVYLLKD